MGKLIDKDALVAEIKRRIKERDFQMKSGCWISSTYMYEDLLDFLNTLEVKEIDSVWNNASDFPKAEAGRSILLIENDGRTELLKSPSAERLFYFRPTNLKMWAYVDELLSITAHFEVKKVDYGIEVHKLGQHNKIKEE